MTSNTPDMINMLRKMILIREFEELVLICRRLLHSPTTARFQIPRTSWPTCSRRRLENSSFTAETGEQAHRPEQRERSLPNGRGRLRNLQGILQASCAPGIA